MPYNETDPITTKDVIDQIRAKNFDGARDSTQELLYKKTSDAMSQKKTEIAKSIGRTPDVFADVIDTTVAQEIEGPINQEPTTNEE